jgi:hypothetical protein
MRPPCAREPTSQSADRDDLIGLLLLLFEDVANVRGAAATQKGEHDDQYDTEAG